MPEAPLTRRLSPIFLAIPIVLTLAGLGLGVMLYLKDYEKDKGTRALEEKARQALAAEVKRHEGLLARRDALRALLGYDGLDYQTWLAGRLAGQVDFKRADEAQQSELRTAEGTVKTLEGDIQSLSDQITAEQQQKQQLITAKRAEIAQKLNDAAAIDGRTTQRTSDLLKRLNDAGATVMDREDERERTRAARQQTKQEQDGNLISIQRQVEQLEDTLSDKRSDIQHVDGRIVRVQAGSDRVVVNLGRRQRMQPGLRFKVVDKGQIAGDLKNPTGPPLIPKSAEVKSEIEIISVGENQSTGVVLTLDFSKPVLPGDAIFNAGYDPAYQTRFVVVGQIDLTGDGQDDRELLERLIGEIGGAIVDKVDVRTDFVLVGTNWPTDDPALRNRYYRDQEQIRAAETLDVSFLSVRRFLDYLGVRIGADGVPRPVESTL
jgi:hypothetical protein